MSLPPRSQFYESFGHAVPGWPRSHAAPLAVAPVTVVAGSNFRRPDAWALTRHHAATGRPGRKVLSDAPKAAAMDPSSWGYTHHSRFNATKAAAMVPSFYLNPAPSRVASDGVSAQASLQRGVRALLAWCRSIADRLGCAQDQTSDSTYSTCSRLGASCLLRSYACVPCLDR